MSVENEIPIDLQSIENMPNDLSILVGTNGSGKSTLLNNLAKYYLNRGKKVVALANSIHDKFEINNRNFKTLRGRAGRRQVKSTIKKSFEAADVDESRVRLKSVTRALEYVKFSPVIGLKVEGLNLSGLDTNLSKVKLKSNELEEINYLLDILQSGKDNISGIIWIQTDSPSFLELKKSKVISIFKWESFLKKMSVISSIEVYLRKEDQLISLLQASSGELALITSVIYLASTIEEGTVILIDEPENSLHPQWQKEYCKVLLDIFYFFQPKIIIATHSPLVVNGAELFNDQTKIFKSESFKFDLQKKEPLNVEEIYFRFFDVSTPQNRFLTQRLITILNGLSKRKISFENFNRRINSMIDISYDEEQILSLNLIKEIGENIHNDLNKLE